VFSAFRNVDVILHGGDIHELRVLDQLSEVAETYSARGNGEDGSGGRPIVGDDPRLRRSWVLDLAGVRVGLTHDMPIPELPPHLTVARWRNLRFADAPLDIVVYGHSHVERIDIADATLCVNPGSPTYPHNLQTQLGTIGFLDIEPGWVQASIWQLTEGDPTRSARMKVGVPITGEAP
jgi:putative phosphoesterase